MSGGERREPQGFPDQGRRLFPHYDPRALNADEPPSWAMVRLLEDGTGGELRWLSRAAGEARLARLVADAGPRALSRRSRAFWSWVLDVPIPTAPPNELWPLG